MLDWILTTVALAATAGLALFANWKAGQPWDDLRPRLLPWRLILIFAVFAFLLAAVHLANLFGIETGPEHSPFGRF